MFSQKTDSLEIGVSINICCQINRSIIYLMVWRVLHPAIQTLEIFAKLPLKQGHTFKIVNVAEE